MNTMELEIKVTLQVSVDDKEEEAELRHAESAREAVQNALELTEDTGFVHPLAADCTIGVRNVELIGIDGVS